uniref:Uncharacterized protein n=1 Tax=Knipowitschia caucasica TaxID=637954 RepID=A0AAV2MNC3_KNICA
MLLSLCKEREEDVCYTAISYYPVLTWWKNRLPRFLSLAHHIAKLELGEAGDPIQHRKRPTLKTQVRKNSAFGQLNILSAHSQEEHPGN